jgi:sec-independent protein translocase protein TatA
VHVSKKRKWLWQNKPSQYLLETACSAVFFILSCNYIAGIIPYLYTLQNQFSMLVANQLLMISMPGGSEWILIILVVLLLFGGRKIPELMRGLGRGIREFNDAKNNVKEEIEQGIKEKDKTTSPQQ